MAVTPPANMTPFAAALWAPVQNIGQTIEHYFQYWYQLAAGDELEWRRFVVTIEDVLSQDTADDAKITFDLVNFTGGALDKTWDDGDYGTAFTHIEGFCTTWAGYMCSYARFARIDAYVMRFNPSWAGSSPSTKMSPFSPPGSPERSYSFSVNGLATQVQAHQVSFSVTEIVPRRANWGRLYMPFANASMLTPAGTWTTSSVDAVVNGLHSQYEYLAQVELFPVVPTTSSQRTRVQALQSVTAVKADDVPDVIRRRRKKNKSYSKTNPLPA